MSMINLMDGYGGFPLMNEVAGDGMPAGAPAAPVEPPVAAPAPTVPVEPNVPQEPPTETVEPVQYEETGDPALDYVLNFVGSLGISTEHPAMQAAINGEFDLLGIELAKSDAKGAANILALAQKSYDKYQSEAKAQDDALAEKLQTIAGGPEQWEEVATWARDNATPEERETLNDLFGKGGKFAEIAAAYLTSSYRGATGTQFEGMPAASPAAAAPAPSNEQLSNIEFSREAQKLYRKYGNAYNTTPEYKALANRLR